MTIETKYDRWDLVWYLDGNKIERNQITAIHISVESSQSDGLWIRYTIKGSNYSEKELYYTKEELIASL